MEHFFVEQLGLSTWLFDWLLLPLFIFLARITDVSLSTIRILFVMSGKRYLAPICGFFEALIWLLMISEIFRNIENAASYLAYASGFAGGTFVGMLIERKLALGKVIVRVIARQNADALVDFLRTTHFGFTNVEAEGRTGKVLLLFLVVRRQELPALIEIINRFNPNAFYTIESVKYVSEYRYEVVSTPPRSSYFGALFRKN
jgi:uncharacterized protein YebE (UPF0316 family)